MNPNQSKKPSKSSIARLLAACFLIFILVACGANSSATSLQTLPNSSTNTPDTPQITPSPTSTTQIAPSPTSTTCASTTIHPSPNFSVQQNHPQITERSGSLCIQTFNSIRCPNNGSGAVPSNQLVLASDRTNYSQAEITQMRSYLSESEHYSWGLTKLPNGTELPPTLQWVLGGSMDSIPASSALIEPTAPENCAMDLELTNIGNTPIQIPKVGVQLEGPPQENTYSYRLINLCSLALCSFGGNGGGCIYNAEIQLGVGNKDTVFSAIPQGITTGCNALTISPAEQVYLYLDFSLASNTSKNLIYSVLPLITVDTAQGESIVAPSQMVSTVAYATAKQFSCYTLQGTAFTLTTAGNDLNQSQPQYCM